MFTQAQTVVGEFKDRLAVGWVDAWDQEGFGDLLQAHAVALLALGLGGDAGDFPTRGSSTGKIPVLIWSYLGSWIGS